jgi:hypothetical protein
MADKTKPAETTKATEPEVLTIADSGVMGKYKDAANIANGKYQTRLVKDAFLLADSFFPFFFFFFL